MRIVAVLSFLKPVKLRKLGDSLKSYLGKIVLSFVQTNFLTLQNTDMAFIASIKKKGKTYFGISFQGVTKDTSVVLRVARKHHDATTLKTRSKAVKWVKDICCIYPMRPGTFQLVAATPDSLKMYARLLQLAGAAEKLIEIEQSNVAEEECDRQRRSLNELYDNFVNEHGLLHNYQSLIDNVWFTDLRLLSLLLFLLEKKELNKGVVVYRKGAIFKKRTGAVLGRGCLRGFPAQFICPVVSPMSDPFKKRQYQPVLEPEHLFDDRDLDERIRKAYDWCLSNYGLVNLERIAVVSNLSVEATSDRLLDLELIYRLPN